MDCIWFACGLQVIWIAGASMKNKVWSTSALRSKKNWFNQTRILFHSSRILFQSSKILFKSHQAVLLKAIDTWIRPIVEAIYF